MGLLIMTTTLATDIKLGQTVRDRITGIAGTAAVIALEMSGNYRITIQPAYNNTDQKVPDTITIDSLMVEQIGAGVSESCPEPRVCNFDLGDEVRNTMSPDLEGTVKAIGWFPSGCVYLDVQNKKLTRDNKITGGWSAQEHWEKIGDHAIKQRVQEAVPGNPPGGPMDVNPGFGDYED